MDARKTVRGASRRPTILIDTNVAAYAHDRDAGSKREVAADLLNTRWDEAILSTQVLVEFARR